MKLLLKSQISLAALLALVACATVDDDTVADNLPTTAIEQAPPQQRQFEYVPALTDPHKEIWRAGYWALIDKRFVWVPGKIIARPSPTAVWQPARWMHHKFGWTFEMGHWE